MEVVGKGKVGSCASTGLCRISSTILGQGWTGHNVLSKYSVLLTSRSGHCDMSALTDVHPFSKAQMNKAPGPDSSSNSECGASIIFHHEKSNFGQTIYIMTIIIIFYNSLWFTHNSLLIHTVSYCYEFLEHHLSKS